jgi:3-deoxy-D-manno-octulosonic-acid transferase
MPILLLFLLLLRLILWPLVKILSLVGPLKKRSQFERKNLSDTQCVSFYETHERADVLFHFSSEGEFEQIKALVEDLIIRGHKLELVFTSPSVEDKVLAFVKQHGDNVRYLRMPLVEFFPFIIGQNILHWSTAKKMVMVRYDFFPDLLTLGMRLSRFVLYSASMKSKTNSGFSWAIKKMIYESFTDIFCATNRDYNFFSKALDRVNVHPALDLRSLQITKRQNNFHKTSLAAELIELFECKEYENRICLAQVWPKETELIDEKLAKQIISAQKLVYLAPHKLGDDFVEQISSKVQETYKDLKIYRLSKGATKEDIAQIKECYKDEPGLIISAIPGVLCESYTYFNYVFIGGGHGKGVHSLLEPYLADTHILCGPGVHRSTEYDLIIDNQDKVFIVEELQKFGETLRSIDPARVHSQKLAEFVSHNEVEMNKLIKILDKHNAE